MRKLKVYIAISLDGYIATANGSIDWLTGFPNPDNTDYGYADFLATTDTTFMGYTTYLDVLKLSETFPYSDKTNYVFTRQPGRTATADVQFIHTDIPAFVQQVKAAAGKDIWLIGGGQLNAALLQYDLIDEMILHMMPVVLGTGIPLFSGIALEKTFRLTHSRAYDNSVLELHYQKV
ncbi:dihydrofolate reductase family protein [Chitinophaga nivalis]|uniref:Dihydrofolate reductase family protein n=1 Tax=Chitinophaga nivalis TaxID=2991709 RepID=A0ABT3IGL0_9BACT|nr:dihydrofolate reductase family protein [Chitinophaga nivalis]MCW3467230.1 dihydrofolate reductase family protein [Chitinophaga nivalis]MCW3483078.1 dihydrofolate reductase family protein [Chitinophaga nivalis]